MGAFANTLSNFFLPCPSEGMYWRLSRNTKALEKEAAAAALGFLFHTVSFQGTTNCHS